MAPSRDQEPLLGNNSIQGRSQANISKLLAGLVGVFLASADKSILLATQEEIASSLHSPSSAPLILVSYNLGFCIALPVYGFLSDIYGCRWFLLSAYALFSLGCLLSGIVTSLWPFVLGRFITGIGGAGMTDLLSVLINEVFKINEVASVRSYIIAAGILGQGCGGPLGGLITDVVGWRWTLIGQVPIGIVCMGLAYCQLPLSMREFDLESTVTLWQFDWGGIVAFFFALTSFILGTTDGGTFLSSMSKPTFLVASCVFLIVFVLVEKFSARNPIIPPSVVSSPRLSNIFLGQMLYFSSIGTIWNNIPGYLAKINHLSNSSIAIQIGICGFGLILGSIIAGKSLSKTVKYRKLSLVAILVSALAQIIMIVRWKDGIQGPETFYCLPWALGSGMLLSAQFISLTICSPPEQMAKATAVYYLSQQIGLVFGTSVSATALRRLFGHQLGHNLIDINEPEKKKVINHLLGDFSFISNLPESIQTAVQNSFIEAWRLIPALSLILTLFVLILVIISREKTKN